MQNYKLKFSIYSWKACISRKCFSQHQSKRFSAMRQIIYQPWAPPETESQNGRGRGVLSGTPARVEGVCSQSVDQGNVWTSRFLHCAGPKHSHTLSAWSSEYEACHAELPAEKTEMRYILKTISRGSWRALDCINSTLNHKRQVPQYIQVNTRITSQCLCESVTGVHPSLKTLLKTFIKRKSYHFINKTYTINSNPVQQPFNKISLCETYNVHFLW